MTNKESCKDSFQPIIPQKVVCIPIDLFESTIGEYFVGYADNLTFGNNTSAWAMLYNPVDSGVNLHVNVWTVTAMPDPANPMAAPEGFDAQVWFNAKASGAFSESANVTPANTAYWPPVTPKVRLLQASNATADPDGGVRSFVRRVPPNTTNRQEVNGKYIFPPGGNFMIRLTNQGAPAQAAGRIAFGWWEERI